MKKIVYTIGLILGTLTAGQSQTKLLETSEELAGVALVGEDMLLVTRKEAGGQYLYTARLGKADAAERSTALNAGRINSVIGGNLSAGEIYIYHKSGRRAEKISIYRWTNGEFVKEEELPLPRMRNHSYNLGMFLTEDQRQLYITAELADSQGYDDLYLSEWNGKRWTKPRNLGKQVNSKSSEFAPFVSNDSLYFSRQQGETAYIYGAPLQYGQPGEAVRLLRVVNEKENYNAYFRKGSDRTVWVSASATEEVLYTAYLLDNSPGIIAEEEIAVEVEGIPEPEERPVEPAKPVRAASPALVLYNPFNEVYLPQNELANLDRYLRQQPAGAAFVVKGYSDGYGNAGAKRSVSEQRAQSVKHYIRRNFAHKAFRVEVESEVLQDKGIAHRKTELYPAK